MNEIVIGVHCPGCGNQSVVYNGNYSCNRCDWVMDPDDNGPNTTVIIVAYLRQRLDQAQAARDIVNIARLQFYLDQYSPSQTTKDVEE